MPRTAATARVTTWTDFVMIVLLPNTLRGSAGAALVLSRLLRRMPIDGVLRRRLATSWYNFRLAWQGKPVCWPTAHPPLGTQNSTGVLALEDDISWNSLDGGSFVESKPMDDAIAGQRTSRAVTSFCSWTPAASGKPKSGGGR